MHNLKMEQSRANELPLLFLCVAYEWG